MFLFKQIRELERAERALARVERQLEELEAQAVAEERAYIRDFDKRLLTAVLVYAGRQGKLEVTPEECRWLCYTIYGERREYDWRYQPLFPDACTHVLHVATPRGYVPVVIVEHP